MKNETKKEVLRDICSNLSANGLKEVLFRFSTLSEEETEDGNFIEMWINDSFKHINEIRKFITKNKII